MIVKMLQSFILERSLLFAAALLHDVAKPAATEIKADGSITSKGHVCQGAKMARQILWLLDVPFHQRGTRAVINVELGQGSPKRRHYYCDRKETET